MYYADKEDAFDMRKQLQPVSRPGPSLRDTIASTLRAVTRPDKAKRSARASIEAAEADSDIEPIGAPAGN